MIRSHSQLLSVVFKLRSVLVLFANTDLGYAFLFRFRFSFISERELMFTFAICRRPSVRLSVVCLSVTFLHPTQPIEIFGNVSAPFNTMVT